MYVVVTSIPSYGFTNYCFPSSNLIIVVDGHVGHVLLTVTAFCSFVAIHDMAVIVAIAPAAMKLYFCCVFWLRAPRA